MSGEDVKGAILVFCTLGVLPQALYYTLQEFWNPNWASALAGIAAGLVAAVAVMLTQRRY